MAQERDELLDHEYDGIREYDNPLPRWWLWLFYGSIIFSVVYLPYYYLGYGLSTAEMYDQEIASAPSPAMAPAGGSGGDQGTSGGSGGMPAVSADLSGDPQAIAAGKDIFMTNCMPCHGDKGQGIIGPNLTDNYWLHGNTFQDIVNVVTNGVPDKGMVPWKGTLNPQKIGQVSAYVKSLQGTNPPNAKEPQGTEYPQ